MNSDLVNNRFSHISSRRKILFFIESLAGGGAENVLTTLVENIDTALFDVTVCSVVDTGVYRDRVRRCVNYCSIIKESNSLFGRLKYKLVYSFLPPKLSYRLFVPKGYDVEIAFIEGYATRIISASTNRHSRKIAWVHIDLMNNHWTDVAYRSRSEESEAYAKFDDVVCVSENVLNSMSSINRSLHNLKVIYNPVDDNAIRDKAQGAITDSKYLDGPIRMVSVGRLVSQKGYDRLLPILKRLHDEGYSFVMNILGDGPDRSELERFISSNEMESYVSLMGFSSNPYPYIKASDLFVCSSRSEGYSTAVTEALILGLPVITTLCSGMKELLGEGEYGVIVDNDDVSLLDGLRRLLSDEALMHQYRKKSEIRGKDFSLERQMRRIEELLLSEEC